ncbi:IS5 family transposase [Oxalobacter vibrioformis]|uniref:IS5 family transposase n=1 Tax=Oxalobacter vibrioformis TaxID=933080 RepID=A0A9E9LYB6_9BURK|nr:IS5 family transposase [Oxalobacter vibrioformis]WAW09684.1 IS5 family transposase [Oxalobacter vibrioformis]
MHDTKLHILVDDMGRLLKLRLSPGQASDHTYAPELIKSAISCKAKAVVGDKGYDSASLRDQIHQGGLKAVIPYRKSARVHKPLSKRHYKQRNIVERFIGRIKENRRVSRRYDKKASHFANFVLLAAIKSWLNVIC